MTARIVASRWLFGLFAALALVAATPPALAQQKVGAATAVNPDTNGTPPGGAVRQVVLGQDIVHNERIATGATGQTQILFLDQSSLTVGENADLTIDDFVFDPSTSTGKLAMSTTKGILRYVGGALSKNTNAVSMVTPSGTLGIRGGAYLLWLKPSSELDVVFLYGDGLKVTPICQGCAPQSVTRPGFFVSIAFPGAPASDPAPAPPGFVAQILAALSSTGHGGSTNPPTDGIVLGSGLSNTLSGDPGNSDWWALHQLPPFTPPPDLNPATLQTTFGLNSAFSHGHTITINNQPPPSPAPTPTPAPTPNPTPTPPPTPPPRPPSGAP
jgi:hypothetical protein